VTAWTQRPEDEHRLLSALLSCFLRFDAIPPDLITGPLADLGLPVPVTVALPPPEDRSFADVWSALGGELKPSLDVVISAPTHTGQQYAAGPPVQEPTQISLGGVGAWPPREARERAPSVAGRITAAAEFALRRGADASAPRGAAEGGGDSAFALGGAGSEEEAGGGAGRFARIRGMTWDELAGRVIPISALEESSPTGGSPAGTGSASDADDAATADKPRAPARRRRQGGISQK